MTENKECGCGESCDCKEIPIEIIQLINLSCFYYFNNPIEYMPPNVQRFIDRIYQESFDV